jgi:hypothetical protein
MITSKIRSAEQWISASERTSGIVGAEHVMT